MFHILTDAATMITLKNPLWIEQFNFPYTKYEDIPSSTFNEINKNLDKVQSKTPLVSILIAAWNEEVNLLKCVASLAKTSTKLPFEIIVINNNSTDKTQATLDRLHVKKLFEKKQGCGPARQLGQENALGKYILLADADCYYPSCWINEMMRTLMQPGVSCIYGRYSFISEPGFPRWKLAIIEKLKDVIAELRHFKRPHLNAYGISMGYVKAFGLKVGYIDVNVRGDDGRLCLGMMEYGEVKQVKSGRSRVWTSPRTLQRDGSINKALRIRVYTAIRNLADYFQAQNPIEAKKLYN